jgi:hypothetical protein
MAGTEYSGANGFAVTGVPSFAPTGGMSAAGRNTLQRDREPASERARERERKRRQGLYFEKAREREREREREGRREGGGRVEGRER